MSLPHARDLPPPQPLPDLCDLQFQKWKFQFEDKIFEKLKVRKVGEKFWFFECNRDYFRHAKAKIQEYLQELGYSIQWVNYKKGFQADPDYGTQGDIPDQEDGFRIYIL